MQLLEHSYLKLRKATPKELAEGPCDLDVSFNLLLKENIPYGIPSFVAGYQSKYFFSFTQLPLGTQFHNVYKQHIFTSNMVIQFALEVVS